MTNYVNVAVPEEHVMAVYGFLGTLERGEAEASNGEAAPVATVGEYTDEMIVEGYEQSSAQMQEALKLLTQAGDRGITTVALAELLGYEHGGASVAGMFGAAHRRFKNHYSILEPWWTKRWISHEDGTLVVLKPRFREVISSVAQ